MSLFEELKRRNVIRVAIAYAVGAWLLVQGADLILDLVGADDWVLRAFAGLLALGFIPAVIFAWAFELTPEGIRKESQIDRTKSITPHTAKKLDIATIAFVIGAVVLLAVDRMLPQQTGVQPDAPASSTVIPADAGIQQDQATAVKSNTASADIAAPPEKSIAVLPFVNMSNDPDQEFFSDGISEELLNVLAKYPGVRVAARTSSFQFKGQNQDIGEIARLLKVRNVLEGSVRKSGNKLRITAQLIQADTGYHLWSETYDRELDDVFAIQDEISAAIGEALRVELALSDGQEKTAPRVAESANTAAYEAFLRGRHLVNQRGRSNVTQATEDLKRAVRLDPDFAPAHAWLAIAWALQLDSPSTYGTLSQAEMLEHASPHVKTALELDPSLAEAWGAQTIVAMNSGDFALALESASRALELNPVYVDALNWRQISATAFGDYRTSQETLEKMVEVDPLSVIGRINFAPNLARYDLAGGRAMADDLAKQHPWAGYTARGAIEFGSGADLSEALHWMLKAYGEDPHDEFSNRYIMRFLATVDEFDEARRISDGNLHIIDLQEGTLENATFSLEQAHRSDPMNFAPLTDLADTLHLAGQFAESQVYYLRLQKLSPTKVIVDNLDSSTRPMIRMAFNYRQLGDEAAAMETISLHRVDLAKREEIGQIFFPEHLAEAMARAMEGEDEAAFESIRTAIGLGLREVSFFREPSLQSLAGHPEFSALQSEVKGLADKEHMEVLQLICLENPIPETWQPMKETCAGVTAGP
jgi:TolB-like protein/Tfp pilus assembly protein PilF